MKTWNEVKTQQHDISGIENPENWTYYEKNGIYYPQEEMKVTYYLFGEDACREFEEEGIDSVVERYEDNDLTYETFKFIDGVTNSASLIESYDGWNGYAILTQEEYEKL